MRVFVTGASGFIGSAVVKELIGAGHRVLGLARSESSAQALVSAGAEVHRGDLTDTESLHSGAIGCDGIIHTAFIHDFADFKANCEIDRRAIETLGAAIAGTGKPLVVTSGTALLSPGRQVTEDDVPYSGAGAMPRIASEEAAAGVASNGAKVMVLRLPPSVHGEGEHGFLPVLINIAREKGVSAYLGEGLNRWPAVHRFDAAALYRLVLEKGIAGAHYHGVAEEGISFRKIAEVISSRLNLPLKSEPQDNAEAHFGWFAHFASVDNLVSSAKTRQQLAWEPHRLGLLEDLDHDYYFNR